MAKLSAKQRRWKEAWEGKRYPWCTCDLKDKPTDRCTRLIARCKTRVGHYAQMRTVWKRASDPDDGYTG